MAMKTVIGKKYYVFLATASWRTFTYNQKLVKGYSSVVAKNLDDCEMQPYTYHFDRWYPPAGHSYRTYKDATSSKRRLDGYDLYLPSVGQTSHAFSSSDLPSATELRDKCMKKAYEKINSSGLNLVVDLAESAATLKMLKATLSFKELAKTFFDELILGKRDRLKRMGMRKRMDYVSGKWLEYRYGWNPLIQTVHDCLGEIHNAEFSRPNIFVKTRAGRSGVKRAYSGLGTYDSPYISRYTSWSRRGQLVAYFKPPDDGMNWSAFGTLNPAVIAWELVPFSFVCDWFVDIGGLLDSMDNYFRYRSDFLSGCYTDTYKIWTVEDQAGNKTAPPLGPGTSGYDGPQHHLSQQALETVYSSRVLLPAWPMYSGVPRVKATLNSSQQTDAVSLIWQIFTKGKAQISSL